MPVAPSPVSIGVLVLAVLAAGTLTGIAGFGFAIVGTMALATVIEPTTAVVFMIIPILSVNLSLIRDLSTAELQACWTRFAPLIVAALIGTVVGMAVLDRVPEAPLRVGLGVLSLAFVAGTQSTIPLPGLSRAKDACFVETPSAMIGIGGISGVLFGGTNVGVQLIAYIRSCDLSHGLFIGVVAMVFLGLNAIRIAAASVLGLYPNSIIVGVSIASAIPAVGGVVIGKRLRDTVKPRQRRIVVLGLLTVIGVRLLLGGLGIA